MEYREALREIYQLNHRLRQVLHGEHVRSMSRSEFHILHQLVDQRVGSPIMKVSDLSKSLCVSPPAVSRTIKALEAKDWIQRVEAGDDRRHTYVEATEVGREAFQQMIEQFEGFMTEGLSQIPVAELEHFIDVGNRLIEILMQQQENL
ncbi:MAG: MarR family transcriptional regulator [Aerococcaceae bacterium]|nr:MarR family transcriptional regulator [Aerococcaceae bacterium]